ncbi:MAG: bacterial Ig-like domain-containing protein, partial [Clostridia bacterium]|nr:bacterial Ig-like domain-containing protein [Clostridia bacterium]
DKTYHWHAASCSHTDLGVDKAKHTSACECGFNMVAKEADDIGNDESVATFADETAPAEAVAAPKVPVYTGNGAALVGGEKVSINKFDPANLSTTKYADGWTDGVFSISKGTEVRGRVKTGLYEGDTLVDANYSTVNSVKLGDSSSALELNASAPGTLEFHVQNGSSGTTGTQTVVLTKPDGAKQDIEYQAAGSGSTIQKITVQLTEQGKYSIARKSGTSDIFYAEFTSTVNITAIEKIVVADEGKVDYLVGQQLDCTGIAVNAHHKDTGLIHPVSLSNISLDTSKYNASVPGTYKIGVTYTLDGNLGEETTFTTEYNVNVYAFDSLKLGTNKIVKDANSAAGNGVYANHALRQFYFVGETFSADGLTVTAIGKNGEGTKEFALGESDYVFSGADTATAGKKTVKVAYTANGLTKAVGVNIFVAEKSGELATADSIDVAVNKEFSTQNVGVKSAAGAYRFKTVQQAVDFINNGGIPAATAKNIYLAEGTYTEKLEITAPNVAIIGAGQDKTKIEFDSLYGVADEGGFVHTTDSTATLNVRDTAVGFSMRHLTVSNKYNTEASYTGAPSNDKRALAMLIQADKVVIEDSALLGFQDTLELFTGRQYFENCLISGSTDFIFGTNNVTYFHNCEIKSVANSKNGGYITAFKGNNKGTTDSVTYGAIFDDCDFTAEDGVPAGKTSIGRAWGANAAVMIMNSRLGGHVSKLSSASEGGRYISMGNGDPKNASFTEYNNTGDGALSEAFETFKLLDEAAAAKYNDVAFIFSKDANAKVKFAEDWNPLQ